MSSNKNKSNRFMPIIMAICVVVGIFLGSFFSNHFSGNRLNIVNSGSNRLNNLLHLIDDQYVDAVNIDSLVDKAIPLILAELDPHSVYISAKDAAAATDDLKGSFSGVGVEFVIRDDTIHIQNVIQNGPAEKAGLLAGDKIVAVDGKPFVGKIVTNQEAMRRLKGPKDTKVKIGVVRYGSKKVQTFTVTRGEIPTKSVTASYMLDDETGYIRIKNFGENTYPEMLIALAKLSQEGFKNLCIDLRDNSIFSSELFFTEYKFDLSYGISELGKGRVGIGVDRLDNQVKIINRIPEFIRRNAGGSPYGTDVSHLLFRQKVNAFAVCFYDLVDYILREKYVCFNLFF